VSTATSARLLRQEVPLLATVATAAPFAISRGDWLAYLADPLWAAFLFAWLFAVVVWGAEGLVHHAERLAALTGEPYGTLILTLSITGIEVLAIGVVMVSGAENPTLARDTMFSEVMIVLNGLVGLALLLGGLRHHEQEYNLRGVNAYLSLILALAVFILIVPNFTQSALGPTFTKGQEGFAIIMCLGLYGVFLAIQTGRHRGYFTLPGAQEANGPEPSPGGSALRETALLLAHLVPIVFLVQQLALILNHGLDVLHAPPAIGGLVVAAMVLFPEGLAAVRAALANRLQRSVNILLGSVLATLALTAPAILVIGLIQGVPLVLGVAGAEQPLLMLTLLLSVITFSNGVTNVLQGAVHLMLFLAYLMLLIRN
jgi:Ca2+:H+ antiporter